MISALSLYDLMQFLDNKKQSLVENLPLEKLHAGLECHLSLWQVNFKIWYLEEV